ncbi:MAG: 1-deoxy-D-xylulose-5-phosphate reductoisomerase [Spirochaetales bacterium]|nr:1-deoxy-D-xylulose-5-phosphate reductoisomerase [Spirochaetales bacterium]
MGAPTRVAVLGATGSIGTQALEVLAALGPDRATVVALSAHRDEVALLRAAAAWPDAELALSGAARHEERVGYSGAEGLVRMVERCGADVVVNGVAGSSGLMPSVAAIRSGARLALANKETMVMAGSLVMDEARRRGTRVIPVDSEHAAVFALHERFGAGSIEELVLTASGGAFRDRPIDSFGSISVAEATRHPNWSMGAKITIDSATMANKGLEVIEAVRLFGVAPERVKVLVHPQSRVHALVRTTDGTLYAQVSEPDMRVPIQNAITWPSLEPCAFGRLDLAGARLEFSEPEEARYPLLGLAYRALRSGEGACVAYNAADEVAVEAFRSTRLSYVDIPRVVEAVLAGRWPVHLATFDEVLAVDTAAREAALIAAKGFQP